MDGVTVCFSSAFSMNAAKLSASGPSAKYSIQPYESMRIKNGPLHVLAFLWYAFNESSEFFEGFFGDQVNYTVFLDYDDFLPRFKVHFFSDFLWNDYLVF